MAEFARQSVSAVQSGDHGYVDLLAVNEANLRQALALADKFRWRSVIISLLPALRLVFLESQRFGTWNRLLDLVSRHFINPQTSQLITRNSGKDYRSNKDFLTFQVEISLKRDHLTQAARWQSILVISERIHTQPVRENRSNSASSYAMNRELISSLAKLGEIYRRMGNPKSIEAYEETFQIAKQTGQTQLAVDFTGRIADAYLAIQVVQNFEQAENWIQAGLELTGERDDLLRSRLTSLHGKTAYERFTKLKKPTNQ